MTVTIKLENLELSNHYIRDNKFRQEAINSIVDNNWGQIIKQEWHKGAYRCLTDTGLIFIVSPEKDKIMTYYLARKKVAQAMFNYKAPQFIIKKINSNSKKYLELFGENLMDSKTHECKMKGIFYEG